MVEVLVYLTAILLAIGVVRVAEQVGGVILEVLLEDMFQNDGREDWP